MAKVLNDVNKAKLELYSVCEGEWDFCASKETNLQISLDTLFTKDSLRPAKLIALQKTFDYVLEDEVEYVVITMKLTEEQKEALYLLSHELRYEYEGQMTNESVEQWISDWIEKNS